MSHTPGQTIPLPAQDDFSLETTVRLLQRRTANRVDRWHEGAYVRVFVTPDGPRRVRVTNAETIAEPALALQILDGAITPETAASLTATVRRVLGLDEPAAPTAWLIEKEPRLAPVATAMHGFRPPRFPTLFETFASVIPFQQLSLDAGTAIVGRLAEALGEPLRDDRDWLAFPAPEAVAVASAEDPRATGLSRAKVATLQEIARLSIDGSLDALSLETMSTPEALVALCTLPGIGPWSAGLALLRGLRRMDVFPAGDAGAARSLTALLGLAAPLNLAAASAIAERFGDRHGDLYFLCLGAVWEESSPGG